MGLMSKLDVFFTSWLQPWKQSGYIAGAQQALSVSLTLSNFPYRYKRDGSLTLQKLSHAWKTFLSLAAYSTVLQHTISNVYWIYRFASTEQAYKAVLWIRLDTFVFAGVTGFTAAQFYLRAARAEDYKAVLTWPFMIEQRCIDFGSKNYVRKWVKPILFLAMVTCIVMPFVAGAMNLLLPCTAILPSSNYLPDCATFTSPGTDNWVLLILISLLELYGPWLMSAVYYGSVIILAYAGEVEMIWLDIVARYGLRSNKRQTFNYVLHYKEVDEGNLNFITQYRISQLMSNVSNIFWSSPLMQINLTPLIAVLISSFYIMIGGHGSLKLVVVLFHLPMANGGIFIILVVFRLLSTPYIRSKEFLHDAARGRRNTNPWFRRFVQSCPVLKVSCGDGKFYDALTSLVAWNFAVNVLVTLLLTK